MRHITFYLRSTVFAIIGLLLAELLPAPGSDKVALFQAAFVGVFTVTAIVYFIFGLCLQEHKRINRNKVLPEVVADIRTVDHVGWPKDDGVYAVLYESHFGGINTATAFFDNEQFVDMNAYKIVGWAGPYPTAAHIVAGEELYRDIGPF